MRARHLTVAAISAAVLVGTAAPASARIEAIGVIQTIAGDGYFSGDYRPALAAQLNAPYDVATDSAGNLYIADGSNLRVRKVAPDGTITTAAGNGGYAPTGDGGGATAAAIGFPSGIDVDTAGNLYIASDSVIRKVSKAGVITTVAGNGTGGFSGDGGPATAAQLRQVEDVAVDRAGNLYLVDFGNERIRRVDTNGIITTFAGIGGVEGYNGDERPATTAQLGGPQSVAVDAAGNVYIADFDNMRVRKVDTAGVIHTIAGTGQYGYGGDDGKATSAQVVPVDVELDSAGNLYVSDFVAKRGEPDHNTVRRIDANGIITRFAGTGTRGYAGDGGTARAAWLNGPRGLATDTTGNVFITDTSNDRIRKVDSAGIIRTVAGTGLRGYNDANVPATTVSLYQPSHAIKDDRTGNLYIADYYHHRVVKVTPDGILTTVAGTGGSGFSGDGGPALSAQIAYPLALAIDSAGNLFIAQVGHRIRKVDTNGVIRTYAGIGQGGYTGDGGPATQAAIYAPNDIALDQAGNLYLADSGNNRVRRIDTDGIITTIAGTGTSGYSGDGSQAKSAMLNSPTGVDVDAAGTVYVADYLNHRIRKVAANGVITTIAGTGTAGYSGDGGQAKAAQVNTPYDVAVDGSGNVYLTDTDQPRIRKIRTDGTIITVAGTGTNGFSGDGGYATSANIGKASGLDVDAAGNLYVSFDIQKRVRQISFTG